MVGKSGSGKSTLINMFTGIDHPTDGEIIVAGTRVRELNEGQMAQWRGRTMGIVFQFFQLLPTLTLAENVMLPMDLGDFHPPRALRPGAAPAGAGGAGRRRRQVPGDRVSGGQQQRAAIARALANDPAIVVADEPTGNLDSQSAETIFALFETSAAAGKTIVMVTHDDELAGPGLAHRHPGRRPDGRRNRAASRQADGCAGSGNRCGALAERLKYKEHEMNTASQIQRRPCGRSGCRRP